jgi:hypothetical protein
MEIRKRDLAVPIEVATIGIATLRVPVENGIIRACSRMPYRPDAAAGDPNEIGILDAKYFFRCSCGCPQPRMPLRQRPLHFPNEYSLLKRADFTGRRFYQCGASRAETRALSSPSPSANLVGRPRCVVAVQMFLKMV